MCYSTMDCYRTQWYAWLRTFVFVCGHLPGESRGQNRERSVIHCIGSACHDYGGKQFRHGIAGIIVSSDHPSGQRGSGTAQDGAAVWWYYVIIGVMCLMMFKVSPNQAGHYSSYRAYYYVHTGEAYNFHQEYLERVAILSGPEKEVQLPAYQFRPWFLCMGEISEDADNEANRSLAMWYHKDSVTLKEKD